MSEPEGSKGLGLLVSLVERHGGLIFREAEFLFPRSGNHLIAAIAGLACCASALPDSRSAPRWREFVERHLDTELVMQFNADGTHHEASPAYHRLVCELVAWTLLCGEGRFSLSDEALRRLERARCYLSMVTTHSGGLAKLGDSDDGLVHIFPTAGSPNDVPRRTASLLEMALELYQRRPAPSHSSRTESGVLPDAGIVVLRSQRAELFCNLGTAKVLDSYVHRHNDQLSFEYYFDGQLRVFDPGTYLYSPTKITRNELRSSTSHSALTIDDAEPCQLDEADPFVIQGYRGARLVQYSEGEQGGSAVATMKLKRGGRRVLHTRKWTLTKDGIALIVEDEVRGSGIHDLHWVFPLYADMCEIVLESSSVRVTPQTSKPWQVHCSQPLISLTLAPHPHSAAYGILEYKAALHGTLSAKLPLKVSWWLGDKRFQLRQSGECVSTVGNG